MRAPHNAEAQSRGHRRKRKTMGRVAITLVMLAGFAGFFWLAWRKLAIAAALQPEPALHSIRARRQMASTTGPRLLPPPSEDPGWTNARAASTPGLGLFFAS